MQRAHPEWSKAKAEAQAIVDFETAATELFVSALERGKALRPAAQWGFYGMRAWSHCLPPLDSRRWPFAQSVDACWLRQRTYTAAATPPNCCQSGAHQLPSIPPYTSPIQWRRRVRISSPPLPCPSRWRRKLRDRASAGFRSTPLRGSAVSSRLLLQPVSVTRFAGVSRS